MDQLRESISLLLLQDSGEGRLWEVVVIEEGLSKNGNFYPASVLEKAIKLFEGAYVGAYFFGESFDHIPQNAKDRAQGVPLRNVIGILENVIFGSFHRDGKMCKGIKAKLKVFESAAWAKEVLREAYSSKNGLGFSIDAKGEFREDIVDGNKVKRITMIGSVDSVDLVTTPAAGGRLMRLVASVCQGEKEMRTEREVLDAIHKNFPKWTEDFDISEIPEDGVKDILIQILESSRNRAVQDLVEQEQGTEEIQEVTHGLQAMQSLLNMLSEGKTEEAMDLLKKMISAGSRDSEGEKPPKEEESQESHTESVSDQEKDEMENKKLEALEARVLKAESRAALTEALATADLPKPSEDRIRKQFDKNPGTLEEIQEAVKEEKDYLAKLSESGKLEPIGVVKEDINAKVTDDQMDKYRKAMRGMLDGEMVVDGVRAFRSLHESYRKITGFAGSPVDMAKRIFPNMAFALPSDALPEGEGFDDGFEHHHEMLRESIGSMPLYLRETLQTTTWAEIFGDSIRRSIMRELDRPDFQLWRKVVSQNMNLADFRTHRVIRLGGFASLAEVPENGTFAEFAVTPDDEEVTFAAQKFGNLFSITMETIINDDLGKIRALPVMLGRAFGYTVNERLFVDNLQANPTIFDSTALFTAGHANTATDALAEASLVTGVQAMEKQTELTSGKRLAIKPKYLVVPTDLNATAWELLNSQVTVGSTRRETVDNVIKGRFQLELIENPFHPTTDLNDWFLIGDPARSNTFVIGWLNGRQEPEILIQDQPTVGSVFSADKITYKIRTSFEVEVLDFRAFYGGIVA